MKRTSKTFTLDTTWRDVLDCLVGEGIQVHVETDGTEVIECVSLDSKYGQSLSFVGTIKTIWRIITGS